MNEETSGGPRRYGGDPVCLSKAIHKDAPDGVRRTGTFVRGIFVMISFGNENANRGLHRRHTRRVSGAYSRSACGLVLVSIRARLAEVACLPRNEVEKYLRAVFRETADVPPPVPPIISKVRVASRKTCYSRVSTLLT